MKSVFREFFCYKKEAKDPESDIQIINQKNQFTNHMIIQYEPDQNRE